MEDDLDAELARLEEEIQTEDAANVSDRNAAAADTITVPLSTAPLPRLSGNVGESGQTRFQDASTAIEPQDFSSQASLGNASGPSAASKSGVVVAVNEPVVVVKQTPEWQRALLQRDYERIHGTNTSTSISPFARQPVRPRHNVASNGERTSTIAHPAQIGPALSSVSASNENAKDAQWSWNGSQWIPGRVQSYSGAAHQTAPQITTGPPAPSYIGGLSVSVSKALGPQVPTSAEHVEHNAQAMHAPHQRHANEQVSGKGISKAGHVRAAAGAVWVDPTLEKWPEDDFRIFVGDLAPDATNEELIEAFQKYPSFNMARVVEDKRTGECKGYGFVSFAKGEDMVAALREMNGKYVGSRPVKLKKSTWQKKELTSEKRKDLRVFKSAGLVSKRRSRKS